MITLTPNVIRFAKYLQYRKCRKTALTIALPALVAGTITTLEGVKNIRAGDYLCVGVAGEIWPMKREHFEQSKEKVVDLANGVAAYRNINTHAVYAACIDERFSIIKENGEIRLTSAPDGGVLVWDGQIEGELVAWIVEKGIFEKSYEYLED